MTTRPTTPGHQLMPFSQIYLDEVDNVRTIYDEAKLRDMEDSILEYGVQQNVGVLPVDAEGRSRLVWGFRRIKGLGRLLAREDLDAELREARQWVPVKVLSEEEAKRHRELQLLENLQREGLDPLDEARAYGRMLKENGYTIETLALAINKPRKGALYIRRRLKLLAAPDVLIDAIRQGIVSVGVGEEVGGMATQKGREEMARRAIRHPVHGVPMPADDVRKEIRRDFNVSIRNCGFRTDDATLLDEAAKREYGHTGAPGEDNDGSCVRCLRLSGNDPLLSDEVGEVTPEGKQRGTDGYLCQIPECFRRKMDAARREIEADAERRGFRVGDKEFARGVFENGVLSEAAAKKYVMQSHRPDYSCTGHFAEEEMPTWEDLLAGEEVSWIVVINPKTRRREHLLEKETAIAVAERKLKLAGAVNIFANRPEAKPAKKASTKASAGAASTSEASTPGGDEAGSDAASEGASAPRDDRAEFAVFEALFDALRRGEWSPELVPLLWADVMPQANPLVARLLGLPLETPHTQVVEHVRDNLSPLEQRGVLVGLLALQNEELSRAMMEALRINAGAITARVLAAQGEEPQEAPEAPEGEEPQGVNWERVKAHYLVTGSIKGTAETFGLSKDTVRTRHRREGWAQERKGGDE